MSSFNSSTLLSTFNDAFVNILELFSNDVVGGFDYLLRKICNIKWSSTVNQSVKVCPIRKKQGIKGATVGSLQLIHCLL